MVFAFLAIHLNKRNIEEEEEAYESFEDSFDDNSFDDSSFDEEGSLGDELLFERKNYSKKQKDKVKFVEKVIFSKFFTCEGNDEGNLSRKKLISKKVKNEFEFLVHNNDCMIALLNESNSNNNNNNFIRNSIEHKINDDDKLYFEGIEGVFNVSKSDIFEKKKTIVWKQIYDHTVFVLVCDTLENIPAAMKLLGLLPSIFNTAFTKVIRETVKNSTSNIDKTRVSLSQIENALQANPEICHLILHYFLPNGILLLMMPDMIDQLCKEMLSTLA